MDEVQKLIEQSQQAEEARKLVEDETRKANFLEKRKRLEAEAREGDRVRAEEQRRIEALRETQAKNETIVCDYHTVQLIVYNDEEGLPIRYVTRAMGVDRVFDVTPGYEVKIFRDAVTAFRDQTGFSPSSGIGMTRVVTGKPIVSPSAQARKPGTIW